MEEEEEDRVEDVLEKVEEDEGKKVCLQKG